ncbi:mediator of RNA polymerase II transcription subunit 1.1-like [Clytia hemisphaerica]|uniref:Uncharacterized protein n=1 Tax=Clytia hemisphaerica TaxID=252671 RepID=A0A7M6DP78_9CNID|eukprot:TCONS_00028191-protein
MRGGWSVTKLLSSICAITAFILVGIGAPLLGIGLMADINTVKTNPDCLPSLGECQYIKNPSDIESKHSKIKNGGICLGVAVLLLMLTGVCSSCDKRERQHPPSVVVYQKKDRNQSKTKNGSKESLKLETNPLLTRHLDVHPTQQRPVSYHFPPPEAYPPQVNGRPVSSFPAYAQYIYVPIAEPPTDPTSAGSNISHGSNQTSTSAEGVPPPLGPVFPPTFQHQPPYLYQSSSCQSPAPTILLPYPISQLPPLSPGTPSPLVKHISFTQDNPPTSPRDNTESVDEGIPIVTNFQTTRLDNVGCNAEPKTREVTFSAHPPPNYEDAAKI